MNFFKNIAYLLGAGCVAYGLWYWFSPNVVPDVAIEVAAPVVYGNEPIQPIPLDAGRKLDSLKVALGERLFNDKRLSHDNSISCASCHDLKRAGMDGVSHSVGINGQINPINTPTVFNSVFNFRQFWNGRAANLKDQVEIAILSHKDMGSTWEEVLSKLRAEASYTDDFIKSYGGLSAESVKDAIATFQSSLVTPNSRFDRFLRGDAGALSVEEKQGYNLFKSYGCSSCHQGMNVGGNMFQKFGVMGDYFSARGNPTDIDLGRYAVTKDQNDMHVFKVPSLRNVMLTAPYFHDGSAPNLYVAVKIMGKYQLGIDLPHEDTSKIIMFLNTLTGEYQGNPL